MPVEREMPRYRSHKEVRALKIKAVEGTTITPEDEGFAPFEVDKAYLKKHEPQPGGYYVVDHNDHKWFAPADDFEAGYSQHPIRPSNVSERADL